MLFFLCFLTPIVLLSAALLLIVLAPKSPEEQLLDDEAQLAFLREYNRKHQK